jgi:hypothetical protein
MHKSQKHALLLLIFVGISLPATVKAKVKIERPFDKIEEARITSVSGVSITVRHEGKKEKVPGKKTVTREKVAETFRIDASTDIQVNGREAKVSALSVGMAVTISADPPAGLDPPATTDGGTARVIIAHKAGK